MRRTFLRRDVHFSKAILQVYGSPPPRGDFICPISAYQALTAFSQAAPRQAKVVELRYFGGLMEEEIVAALQISPRTVRRDWDLAKAWLLRELSHRIGPTSHAPRAFPAD